MCQGAADCLCCGSLYVRCSSIYLASARTSWRTQALSACIVIMATVDHCQLLLNCRLLPTVIEPGG